VNSGEGSPLAGQFALGLAERYREGQGVQQAVLADFIEQGHLTSHIRRMCNAYGMRRQLLRDAITNRLGEPLPVIGDEAGRPACSC
jgi:GntR family transcriptional regulator/MocR family aminotransferase